MLQSTSLHSRSLVFGFVAALVLLGQLASPWTVRIVSAAESTEESIALYADSANFQTNGALDLAIESWNQFLKKYPDDELAPKAAHYLGVCYMQRENPDYVAAAESFARALKEKKYELREESLANQGWCYYASAGDGPKRDEKRLKQTIATFELLRQENPKSDYIDRAYFYSGEAAYGLGQRQKAIDLYDDFLALPKSEDSPLRCDALYARGIAHEELGDAAKSLASFKQLLSECADSDLAVDVHLRMGDLLIGGRDFGGAVNAFDSALEITNDDADKSYAIFRQAYALVQGGKPNEAAKRYDRLQKEFPKSPYAANATLASGQSLYRGGKIDLAAERFRTVLKQNNPTAATEASHWLARIALANGDSNEAASIARRQIEAGIDGDFAMDLRIDLAESLALDPKTVEESIEVAEKAYRDAPEDNLAPRALYNAAFSALQISDFERAASLSDEFLKKFPKGPLASDVRFIIAESQLLTGKIEDAIENYRTLLSQSDKKNMQRPLWALRTATALNANKSFDESIALLKSEYSFFKDANQKAEAQFTVAQAHLRAGRPGDAAISFGRAFDASKDWPRRSEAKLLQGTAFMSAGKRDQAESTWKAIVAMDNAGPMADQARYKLAQLSSNESDHANAIKLYDKIIASNRDQGLIPYALYGRGWSHMQNDDHGKAIQSLDRILSELPKHPVSSDALIARGISHRSVGNLKAAQKDLSAYLKLNPTGANLGHALYELALVEQKSDQPASAAKRLERLVDEVPTYPGMDKVLYELGWSLRESGELESAEAKFKQLLQKYPATSLSADAAYFVGQQNYSAEKWSVAAEYFQMAAENAADSAMSEKSWYRLGWSYFKDSKLNEARNAFENQAKKHGDGKLAIDAHMMVGECAFKESDYDVALKSYDLGRKTIRAKNDNSSSIRDEAERQVRELILLHGGQSAAQLKRWDDAIGWYNELKDRFPATTYLPQVFYETGFAYQQKGDDKQALNYFTQVADRYRTEVAARARFMMGEIHFGAKRFDKAIPEFQRVMFGFGAEKAPADIKNWQAKSGFEAGRCSELLMQTAKSGDAKNKSRQFAKQFYDYVVKKHAGHELAKKSSERLEALN